jgi:hypothetical protein
MLTLEQAARIVDVALVEGAKHGFKPLCIVVLDAGVMRLRSARRARVDLQTRDCNREGGRCLGMGFGGREIARRAAACRASLQRATSSPRASCLFRAAC